MNLIDTLHDALDPATDTPLPGTVLLTAEQGAWLREWGAERSPGYQVIRNYVKREARVLIVAPDEVYKTVNDEIVLDCRTLPLE